MNEISLVEIRTGKNSDVSIYKGYNCTLKVRKWKIFDDMLDFEIEHEDICFAPKIYPVRKTEDFFFDFSNIVTTVDSFEKVKNCLTDIEKFCEEFLRRKEEFEFIKEKETTD